MAEYVEIDGRDWEIPAGASPATRRFCLGGLLRAGEGQGMTDYSVQEPDTGKPKRVVERRPTNGTQSAVRGRPSNFPGSPGRGRGV